MVPFYCLILNWIWNWSVHRRHSPLGLSPIGIPFYCTSFRIHMADTEWESKGSFSKTNQEYGTPLAAVAFAHPLCNFWECAKGLQHAAVPFPWNVLDEWRALIVHCFPAVLECFTSASVVVLDSLINISILFHSCRDAVKK